MKLKYYLLTCGDVRLSVGVCLPAQLRGEQPSYLKGDNFFKFICSDCSEDGKESFERMRLTWQQVRTAAAHSNFYPV